MFYQDPEVEKILNEKKGKLVINFFLIPIFIAGIYFGFKWMVLDILTTAYFLDSSDLVPVSNGIDAAGELISGANEILGIQTVQPVSDAGLVISVVVSILILGLGFALAHSRGWVTSKPNYRLKHTVKGLWDGQLSWADLNTLHVAAVVGWVVVWMVDNITDVGWKTSTIDSTITPAQIFVLSVYLSSYFFIEMGITVLLELVVALLIAQWRHLVELWPKGLSDKWASSRGSSKHQSQSQQHNKKQRPQNRNQNQNVPSPAATPGHRDPHNGPVQRFAQEMPDILQDFMGEDIPFGVIPPDEERRAAQEARRPKRDSQIGRIRQRPPRNIHGRGGN